TKLDIEGADRFEVANLHYTVKSMSRFKDKVVLISGGGNSAVDWANELEPIAKKVILTYRKDVLKGHEAEVTKWMKSSVSVMLNSSIGKLIAKPGQEAVGSVTVHNHEDGSEQEIAVDEVIINHGYDRDSDLLEKSEVKIQMHEKWGVAGNASS